METIPIASWLAAAHDGADAARCPDPHQVPGAFAEVRILTDHSEPVRLTREGLIRQKRECEAARQDAFGEFRKRAVGTPEKSSARRRIEACTDQAHRLEELLGTRLLPQHGPTQFIGPRTFLQGPLFRVAGKQSPRAAATNLVLVTHPLAVYRGPELRQGDGLVFSALLHMARDVLLGSAVSFHAEHVCLALLGRYDGNTRRQLRESIQRLQSGVVAFDSFSVQLCLRFDYPKRGRWSVALHHNIVALFPANTQVWLDVATRVQLPEGLATWLYGYVRSQSRLIPMHLETLRQRCGSEASPKAFMNGMRLALRELAKRGVVAPGWSLGAGTVRWMKGPQVGALASGHVI